LANEAEVDRNQIQILLMEKNFEKKNWNFLLIKKNKQRLSTERVFSVLDQSELMIYNENIHIDQSLTLMYKHFHENQ